MYGRQLELLIIKSPLMTRMLSLKAVDAKFSEKNFVNYGPARAGPFYEIRIREALCVSAG